MSREDSACSMEEGCVNDGTSKCNCTFCLNDFKHTRKKDTPQNVLKLSKGDRVHNGVGVSDVGLLMQSSFDEAEKFPNTKKHARIRAFVASGLNRIGCVKDDKSLKYLGVTSFDTVIEHIQNKMDSYNAQQTGGEQMSFANIELDHIKPVKQFALELSHYTNLQPLLKKVNRSKAAKWTHTDDTFWRANIQHQPEFTDMYADTTMRLSGNNIHNNKNSFDRQQSQINRQRWKDMDCIPIYEAKMIYQKWLHGSNNNTQFMDILATIREVEYSQIQSNEMHLANSRTQLKNIIQCDISKYKIYENIFIYPHMLKKFCNLMLGIYTQKKLQQISALNSQKDYIVKNIDTTNSKVLLLHEMSQLLINIFPTLPQSSKYSISPCTRSITKKKNLWTLRTSCGKNSSPLAEPITKNPKRSEGV